MAQTSLLVRVALSDDAEITIPISVSTELLQTSRNRVRDAVKAALFSEFWKKVANHGLAPHYDIEIPVNYAGLRVTYAFCVPAQYAIDAKGHIAREISNKTAEIEHNIAYVITHIN